MYENLSGMTGTAKTEEAEFIQIYNLEVVEVPTNVPIQRIDQQDAVYKTTDEKLDDIILTSASITFGDNQYVDYTDTYSEVDGYGNFDILKKSATANGSGNYENEIVYYIPSNMSINNINGPVKDLSFAIIDEAGNQTTFSNNDISSTTTQLAVDTISPQIEQNAGNNIEQWKVQVYINNTWTDKTTSNGIGSDQKIAYSGERIYYSFRASELLPTDATKALLSYNPSAADPPVPVR